MKLDLLTSLYVFMLAGFIGFEFIRRITPLLHTPLVDRFGRRCAPDLTFFPFDFVRGP